MDEEADEGRAPVPPSGDAEPIAAARRRRARTVFVRRLSFRIVCDYDSAENARREE